MRVTLLRHSVVITILLILLACSGAVVKNSTESTVSVKADNTKKTATTDATKNSSAQNSGELGNNAKKQLFYRTDSYAISLQEYEDNLKKFNKDIQQKILQERKAKRQTLIKREQKRKEAYEQKQLAQKQIKLAQQETMLQESLQAESTQQEAIKLADIQEINETPIDELIADDTPLADDAAKAETENLLANQDATGQDATDDALPDAIDTDEDAIEQTFIPLALLNMLAQKDDGVSHEVVQANYYHYIGWERAGIGEYEAAIKAYRQALQHNPADATPHNSIGIAKVALGDVQGAIEEYSRAIAINPYYPAAFHNRGKAKAESGDYEGAITDYRLALRLNVDVGLVYMDRAIARYKSGKPQEALKDLEKALELGAEGAEEMRKQIKNQEL